MPNQAIIKRWSPEIGEPINPSQTERGPDYQEQQNDEHGRVHGKCCECQQVPDRTSVISSKPMTRDQVAKLNRVALSAPTAGLARRISIGCARDPARSAS
jgi:hypothetical protein